MKMSVSVKRTSLFRQSVNNKSKKFYKSFHNFLECLPPHIFISFHIFLQKNSGGGIHKTFNDNLKIIGQFS